MNAGSLIDSGADQNCIKAGIVPTKFSEQTREQLVSANGEPLTIRYKLNKGHIQNNNYCFKNVFLIVDNITNDIILGTPFHTQIVQQMNVRVKSLPCLNIPNPSAFIIVKTDASDIGYDGILKQKLESYNHGQLFGITSLLPKLKI